MRKDIGRGGWVGNLAWCSPCDGEACSQNELQSSHAGSLFEIEAKSGPQRLSVGGDLSAFFEDRLQVKVAGIGDMCGPGRYTSEIGWWDMRSVISGSNGLW